VKEDGTGIQKKEWEKRKYEMDKGRKKGDRG
jgi:hypothetical protein